MLKKSRRLAALLLAAAMLLALPVSADTGFSDVPANAWYGYFLEQITTYTPGIITGYGDGTFRPGDEVKRGEFLRMISTAAELYTESSPPSEHWAAKYWQMSYEEGLLLLDSNEQSLVFGYSFEELEAPITRYEMAVIVTNAMQCYRVKEARVTVKDAGEHIPDYSAMPTQYKDAVEQVYGKGIIKGIKNTDGVEDGSFCGDWTLIRSEALTVIYFFLWSGARTPASFAQSADKIEYEETTELVTFAMQYRDMSVAERRQALFGDENKTHFTSSEEAKPFMESIQVNIWRVDGTGNKYSDTVWLTVHRLVAEEVGLIFEEIYNDPERFPLKSLGGARFTDSLCHSWGCAIDLNWEENCYCRVIDGQFIRLTGDGYWPGENQYSFTPGCSVVRAFAKYGWGWGGQGYSGGYYDYMHFSILSSGG